MLVRFFTIPSLAYAEPLSIQLENTVISMSLACRFASLFGKPPAWKTKSVAE